ncbi:MAG: tRNA (cytidine(34)-2'-O)-methyltransferase [Gammaproteobacteria bacterium]|nr:MAG: tRNA (cytidine(34)-2'-O)-methyltransferase [Gammaproteobacteria bacterium]
MFDLVLFQPEIPPNTGNIIRLCANTGTRLHLVEPLGFTLEDRYLRRAGLDYHDMASVTVHPDLASCLAGLAGQRLFAVSTRGRMSHAAVVFAPGDVFLLGPETAGLPGEILSTVPRERVLRIPMKPGSRSLNLSNAAAVVVYEAWRQLGFPGGG